ncbi:hypothetical protein GCM10022225_81390 [Plantactinospora mayteni]|uniref:Uncharacterized protein n=1 Tax=Plantactinospora mayteni TaxID=566021 RepID=A0ABQ4F3Q2_9ACTN|nr:hypothetical protein [Plantactinospora mayteni]GIH01544.1 hypothetical protein Pma05_81160 [Plantactinospora mayteni]
MNHTTTLPHADRRRSGQGAGIGGHALARWPSIVGLLTLLASTAGGLDSHLAAMIIILAAMCYLATAALGSRRSTWVMVAVGTLAVAGAEVTGLDPTTTLLVMGAGFAVFGFLRGTGVGRRELGLQTLGFIGFSAIALTAMMSGPALAAYLAAIAAIGHAVWDVIHYIRDKVVSRSLTEFCFVLDFGLGAALLLAAWNVIPR